MGKTLAGYIVRFKFLYLFIFVVATIFFGYFASTIRTYDDPNKWPPENEYNVKLNNCIQEDFGGANVVTVGISVVNGTIFNRETLGKVKRISDKILETYGVVPYYLTSLSALKTRYMRGKDDYLDNSILMPYVPEDEEDMERLKYGVYHNPTIYRSIVSEDSKSTIIIADFRTGIGRKSELGLPQTTPVEIYRAINKYVEAERDENHIIDITGSPIIIGWVNSEGLPYMLMAFCFFLAVIAVVLWFTYEGSLRGVILTIAMGLSACIWAAGIYVLIFGEIIKSSSGYMAPFIIMSAAACHTVQFFRRFFNEEYPRIQNANAAIINTYSAIFLPMGTALITDVSAFTVLSFIPFENVSVLGRMTCFGLMSLIICMSLFILPVLSFSPGRFKNLDLTGETEQNGGSLWEKVLAKKVCLLIDHKVRWLVLTIVMVASFFAIASFFKIDCGQDNTYAIHNLLTKSWKRSPVYKMEMNIKDKFKGVYPLNVLIEAPEEGGLQDPANLEKIDKFAEYLQELPNVAGCMHLPVFIKLMHRFMHEENDEYFILPDNKRAVSEYLYMYSLGEPGSFDAVVDSTYQRAVLVAFVSDTSRKTVEAVFTSAKKYAEKNFNDDEKEITAKVGGGIIGVTKAFNDNIKKWLVLSFVVSGVVSFIMVILLLRSLVAAVFLIVPLIMASFLWMGTMAFIGIEMNSNAAICVSIAMGVGIDAGFYLLYRFREEFSVLHEFKKSVVATFVTTGKSLVFSFAALIMGCWALIPIPLYVGYIGFGIGLILLYCLVLTFVVSPILWGIFRPEFLVGDSKA